MPPHLIGANKGTLLPKRTHYAKLPGLKSNLHAINNPSLYPFHHPPSSLNNKASGSIHPFASAIIPTDKCSSQRGCIEYSLPSHPFRGSFSLFSSFCYRQALLASIEPTPIPIDQPLVETILGLRPARLGFLTVNLPSDRPFDDTTASRKDKTGSHHGL